MNFFQKVFDQIDGIPVQMNFQRKNGKITISVLPTTTATITPAIITGTPEELEAGFFEAIQAPIAEAKGLQVELDALKASVKRAKDQKPVTSDAKENKEPKPVAAKTATEPKKVDAPDLFAGV